MILYVFVIKNVPFNMGPTLKAHSVFQLSYMHLYELHIYLEQVCKQISGLSLAPVGMLFTTKQQAALHVRVAFSKAYV